MRLLFTCFLFSSLAAFSQTKLPVLIPASPEVSSLLNDVSFSSSLYTGSAQTNFNFHTLKLGSFQMPITAEYFTNGIRVDDIPSRIGLGWNLNAGGYVSRVVRDEPDGSSTFLNPPANLWQKDQNLYNYLNLASGQGYDTEWDEYSYSFNGYSGRFYVDENGNGVTIPLNNLKIKVYGHNSESKYIEIFTPDGVKYEFGFTTKEQTRQITYQTDGNYGYATKNYITETAWFLDRITTAENQLISLYYSPVITTAVTGNFQQMVKPYFSSNVCNGTTCSSSITTGTNFTKYDTYYLTNISCSSEVVDFFYESRPDNSGDVRLKTLSIRNVGLILSKKYYRFDYYTPTSNNNSINKRYFLTAIRQKEIGTGNSADQDSGNFLIYGYDYFDMNSMPDRLTNSQDWFGYNNGKTSNAYLVPFISSFANYVVNGYSGSDRNPSDVTDIQKGTLQKIILPTGGYKQFEYEQHSLYSNNQNILVSGIRVKKIINFDPVSQKRNTKYYKYSSFSDLSKSSGVGPVSTQNFNLERYGITCNEGTFAANIQQCNSYLVSSNSLFPVNLFSGSPYAYNNVIESDDSTFSNGFTEHMFHAYIPSNVLTTWLGSSTSVNATNMTTILNGLEYKTRFYKKASPGYILLKEIENQYQYDSYSANKTSFYISKRWNYAGYTIPIHDDMFDGFDLVEYRFVSNWIKKTATTVKDFDENGINPIVKTDTYTYADISHQQITKQESTSSSNESITTEFYYPIDKGMIALVNAHRISTPVHIKHFKSNALQSETETAYNYFGNYLGVSQVEERILGNAGIKILFNAYDNKGHVIDVKRDNDKSISYIWSSNSDRVLAEVQNASKDDIAYTSFEDDADGNWTISSGNRDAYTFFTGKYGYSLSNGSIERNTAYNKTYTLTYWTQSSSSLYIPGTYNVKAGPVLSNGWRFFEHAISGVSSVLISGSSLIDEVSLYPSVAQIKTFTYNDLGLISSVSDESGKSKLFTYDGLGRLKQVMDESRNILDAYQYAYLQPTMSCTFFTPLWQSTGITRCQINSNNNYTGYIELQNQDLNPCSPTYLQTTWSISSYSPSTCPAVPNCTGEDKRIVNGVCETGMMVVTGGGFANGMNYCTYHYEWSDGYWSPNYTGYGYICSVQ